MDVYAVDRGVCALAIKKTREDEKKIGRVQQGYNKNQDPGFGAKGSA